MSRVKNIIFKIAFLVLLTLNLSGQRPDSICGNAGVFCSKNSMIGPWDLPDSLYTIPSFNICSGTGQSQNAYFFAFVPTSSTVRIEIKPLSITNTNGAAKKGYQYGIVDRCDFNDDEIKYMDCDGSDKITTNRIVGAIDFIQGHTYYLYIDGYEGSKVSFELQVLEGIGGFVVDPIDSFKVILYDTINVAIGDTINACFGGDFEIEAYGGENASFFEWTTQDTLENSDSIKLNYSVNFENTTYKICAKSMTECDISDSSCFFINVDTVETMLLDTAYVCKTALLTNGYKPNGWHGGIIDKEGTFYYNYKDYSGCVINEQVTVYEVENPVYEFDEKVCDSDVFYADTMIRDTFKTIYGCDSIVIKHISYFDFKGSLNELTCSNDSFLLIINQNGFDASNYKNILVEWFDENDNAIQTNFGFVPLLVKKPGKYYVTVTVFGARAGVNCIYTLGPVAVDALPSSDFTMDKDIVCSSDTLFFEIDNNIDSLNYIVSINKGAIRNISNGKYFITWNKQDTGKFDLNLEVAYKDCSFSVSKRIVVEEEIVEPIIDCFERTNNSIVIKWDSTGCVDKYEVWVDSKLYNTVNVAHDTIKGLIYGQKIGIEIKVISGCECEGKTYADSCSTINCPDRTISIDNIPSFTCFDELDDSTKMSFNADTIGKYFWLGDAVDSSGVVYKDRISAGDNKVSFFFEVAECKYRIDTIITIYPTLDAEWSFFDISCYDSNDGILEVNPNPVMNNFVFRLNDKEYNYLTVDSLPEGDYSFVLSDSNNCKFHADFTLVQPDKPDIKIIGENKVKFNTQYKYFIEFGDDTPDSVYWYKNDSLVCTSICDTIIIEPNILDGNFELCAVMFYDSICDVEVCKEVKIDREFNVYIPNVFTPNFDDINDYFTISSTNGFDLNIKTFRVYNRWGEEMFYDKDFTISGPNSYFGWNGLIRGEKAAIGVYVYYIEVISDDGEIIKYYGDITLMR